MEDTIGTNLKRFRLAYKMSQEELSRKSGVSKSYISEVESNVYTNVTSYIICSWCKVLQITPNELIPKHMYL